MKIHIALFVCLIGVGCIHGSWIGSPSKSEKPKDFACDVCLYVVNSDGSNNVRSSMFECSKPKLGVRVGLPKDEHVQCPFDVRSTVR